MIDSTFYEKIMDSFPDAYNKNDDSNLSKLIKCIAPEFDEVMKMFTDLKLNIDMDYATDATLTKIALNVNQERGQMGDKILRVLMKAKIAADMSDGTVPILYDVLGFIFEGGEHSRIQELWEGEQASMLITAPIDSIVELGLTINQFIDVMTRVKVGGVRIYANMQGSFEFVSEETYNNDKQSSVGFGNEEMTVGGTLGMQIDTSEGSPLPLGGND